MQESYELFAVDVADKFVLCSLMVTNNRRCGAPAFYVVQMENGDWLWRCSGHRGIRRLNPDSLADVGVYSRSVLVRKDSVPNFDKYRRAREE